MTAPIEVTTRYATTVDDLAAAWAFIMGRLDAVGPDPMIEISPYWRISMNDAMEDRDLPERQFSVVLSGMVPEPEATP